ncbi:aminotransferase class I/II-fold pyridoxal phosphate-dependent enzyme [Vineibacter terrae]|uniref:aminotransferase class I/II-fold pyridoxal phosphate-dependent enzyme n=1 Tax=Vineibacter terrae TaxID=2586908 RepID=UPI002E37F42A|nr:aminotransferase class I/II-fold pyridoxal phosphate-dependent enzyme [Vineibacter terrae]HEX2889429.1 aminotransferase class I/II-fold pyridoxal phosphate-dependent enzyme [Vineibacter terrae]
MSNGVSKRAEIVPPFIVMDVISAANEMEARGEKVIHCEVGQPSTSAPKGALAAAHAALDRDRIGYVEALGIPPLRERIARHYAQWYGVTLDPQRVVVTTGSSAAFLMAFLAAFDPGARVAMAAPGYPPYRNILAALGMVPVDIVTTEAERYQPTVPALDATGGGLAGLIVASPSNPTGTMVSRDEMAALSASCRARGMRLISDEIYHGLTFEERGVSALEVTDDAIVINSFSKYFSMTGWRIGWMVVPPALVRPIERLTQNLLISTPTLSQFAALAAFDCTEELEAHVRRYRVNRDLLLAGLPKAGFDHLTRPTGAFYLYADVAHLTNDSVDFCRRMLREAGVAATPGVDFDPQRGHRTLRFSFAGSTADMEEAVRRLTHWKR